MCVCVCVWRYIQPGGQGSVVTSSDEAVDVKPGGQGSVVTSGDEAVVRRACHQQQVNEHSLGVGLG